MEETFTKYLERTNMDKKPYQYDGVRWMLNNELTENPVSKYRGGFIADEMGLGKTIMMIGLFLCNYLKKTLIVVPPVLIEQWYDQIYKTTGHEPLIYHGSNKKFIGIEDLNKATIVITTYGAITLSEKDLRKKKFTILHNVNWSRIVFDEAHHLRNKNTVLYASARKLTSSIRWLVSGTPIQNRKQDFYSLCSMIRIPPSYYKASSNLRELARIFLLKRTKKQVGIIMNDIIETKHVIEWKNDNEMELSQELHSALKFCNIGQRSKNMDKPEGLLAILLRSRQTCVYPKMLSNCLKLINKNYYKEAFKSSSKLDYVVETILKNKDNNCGKLVFCTFHQEIDELYKRLVEGGIKTIGIFDGRTSSNNRRDLLSVKREVLLLQIQSGCEGLNLQENYNEIYFVSPHWNPAVEDQAVARCHRIGQKRQVYVQRFEMAKFDSEEGDSKTLDNYIYNIQDRKRGVTNEMLEEGDDDDDDD